MKTKYLSLVASGVGVLGLATVPGQAQAPASPQGVITARTFLDIGGGVTVADLTGSPKFPNNPDRVDYPPYFEWPVADPPDLFAAPPADVWNNYGVQILGYFYPPPTATMCSTSPPMTAARCTSARTPTRRTRNSSPRRPAGARCALSPALAVAAPSRPRTPQTFTGTQWPTRDAINGGARITLQAGRAYYIEALAKEGGGGDNLAVAVQDPQFLLDSSLPIPGEYLSSFDKTTGPVSITTQPQSQTVEEGQPVTFAVVANGTPLTHISGNVTEATSPGPTALRTRSPTPPSPMTVRGSASSSPGPRAALSPAPRPRSPSSVTSHRPRSSRPTAAATSYR
ncbi:MAG: hypothetical protein M5U12_30275 [Verrucomicrobia bacterium]|nr:hypothetical protein [Verrucomicrobiota bacterium]